MRLSAALGLLSLALLPADPVHAQQQVGHFFGQAAIGLAIADFSAQDGSWRSEWRSTSRGAATIPLLDPRPTLPRKMSASAPAPSARADQIPPLSLSVAALR